MIMKFGKNLLVTIIHKLRLGLFKRFFLEKKKQQKLGFQPRTRNEIFAHATDRMTHAFQ